MDSTVLVLVLRDGRLSFGDCACFSCRAGACFPLLVVVVVLVEDFKEETVPKPEKVLRFCFLRSVAAASSRAVLDGLSQEPRLSLTMMAVGKFRVPRQMARQREEDFLSPRRKDFCHSLQGGIVCLASHRRFFCGLEAPASVHYHEHWWSQQETKH